MNSINFSQYAVLNSSGVVDVKLTKAKFVKELHAYVDSQSSSDVDLVKAIHAVFDTYAKDATVSTSTLGGKVCVKLGLDLEQMSKVTARVKEYLTSTSDFTLLAGRNGGWHRKHPSAVVETEATLSELSALAAE